MKEIISHERRNMSLEKYAHDMREKLEELAASDLPEGQKIKAMRSFLVEHAMDKERIKRSSSREIVNEAFRDALCKEIKENHPELFKLPYEDLLQYLSYIVIYGGYADALIKIEVDKLAMMITDRKGG